MRHGIISLDEVNRKERLVIVSHNGEEEVSRRLSDMGLVDGVEFEVMIPGGMSSPYLVRVDNTRIAIENDLARKLNVISLDNRCQRHGFKGRHRIRRGRRFFGRHSEEVEIENMEGLK